MFEVGFRLEKIESSWLFGAETGNRMRNKINKTLVNLTYAFLSNHT